MPTYTKINGSNKNDLLIANDPTLQYLIKGGNGDDVVVGNAQEDVLHGENGNDSVYGEGQSFMGVFIVPDVPAGLTLRTELRLENLILPLGANDMITGDNGDDKLFGEYDLFYVLHSPGNATSNGAQVGSFEALDNVLVLFGADHIDGGNGNDVIMGDTGLYPLDLRLGSTYAAGVGALAESNFSVKSTVLHWGNDVLWGGNGDDFIYGDFLAHVFTAIPAQAYAIDGGVAKSTYTDFGGIYIFGNDIIEGGNGNDKIWGDYVSLADNVFALTAHAENGGTARADLHLEGFVSDGGHDVISGGNGDDTIYGDFEHEIEHLKGGHAYAEGIGSVASANATYQGLTFHHGNDVIDGDNGNDIIFADSITFTLKETQGTAVALNGGVASAFASIENTQVVAGNDIIRGGNGNDVIFADPCAVNLLDQALTASSVNIDNVDYVVASDHKNNSVRWGNDQIQGGNGADTFVFNLFHTTDGKLGMQGHDVILDFNRHQDILAFGSVIDTDDNALVNLLDILSSTLVNRVGNNTVINFEAGGSLTLANNQFNSIMEIVNIEVSSNMIAA